MPDKPLIKVDNLVREFSVAEGESGFLGSIKNLFSRKKSIKRAVDNVSFSINPGEFVGLVGENGAGKSTTIKILTGILVPTSGSVDVSGIVPYENRKENSKNIGVVFGQRTQLWWDLPVRESFDLLRSIFRVPDEIFHENFKEITEVLDLGPLLKVPVRKLSLGQRMRCDMAAALIHSPRILFLDEPTIGLDILAKEHVRAFLKKINDERGVTIILTTHDMDDIETLCNRIMILDEGVIVYDGPTETLKERYVNEKILKIEFDGIGDDEILTPHITTVKKEGNIRWLSFKKDETNIQSVITKILGEYCVKDIAIHEPKVEDIVKNIYSTGNSEAAKRRSGAVAP